MLPDSASIEAASTGRLNLKFLGYCLIVGFAATAFGFDQGETSGFLAMPQYVMDFGHYDSETDSYAFQAGTITYMYGLELGFALLASLASGAIGSRWGRKTGLILCAISGLIGSAIQMIASWPAQIVGRVFLGMSIGFAGNFTITYWSETAPGHLRGVIVIFYQLFINVPNFIGACVNQGTHALPNRWSYRGPLLTTMIMPILLLLFIKVVPESPRWLVTRDRITDAKISIRKLRGPEISQEELDREIDEVVAFTQLEKQLEDSTSYWECFKGTDLRRTMIASLMTAGQQLMGIAFISAYSTYFFALVGLEDAFIVTVIVNACQIAGPLLAFWWVTKIGRRRLLIVGAAVCGFCMLAFATIAKAVPNSTAAAKSLTAFICIFCFTYAGTWGSIGPVVLGEVPSNRLRSKTVSIALSFSWVVCLAVICSVPYLLSADYANLGTEVGFIFGALTIAVLVVTILILPETKDRTLEEIDEMFLNHVGTRKFKNYVCTGQVAGYDLTHTGKEAVIVTEVEKV